MKLSRTLLLLIFGNLSILIAGEDELISVVVLYRHGDRGPITSYPGDPYYDLAYWPEGFGQLTNQGKMRHFELGKWLRGRYGSALPLSPDYSPTEVLVESSSVDRCLMSAASNLAGLYLADTSDVYPFPWEPVPIHNSPQTEDAVLRMARDCPRYEELYEQLVGSKVFDGVLEGMAETVGTVERWTGWNVTEIGKLANLWSVFYVYRMHNTSYVPGWAYDLDPGDLEHAAGLSFASETYNDELKRFKAGPLVTRVRSHLDLVIEAADTTPKFLMLSAHDGTVAALLNSLGLYDMRPPEFTATVIWELYRREGATDHGNYSSHYVNLLYKRPSETGLEKLTLEGCGSYDCDYGTYREIVDRMGLVIEQEDWLKECQSRKTL